MCSRREGDAAGERVERSDVSPVDVQLRIAHVTSYIDDCISSGDAIRCDAGTTGGEPAHQQERASYGAPDSVASTTSPTIFTATVVSLAGGFFTIDAIRSIESAVVTPITQPAGDTRRSVARDTPRAPIRCLSSAWTMAHGVDRASRTSTTPDSPTGVSSPEKLGTWAGLGCWG